MSSDDLPNALAVTSVMGLPTPVASASAGVGIVGIGPSMDPALLEALRATVQREVRAAMGLSATTTGVPGPSGSTGTTGTPAPTATSSGEFECTGMTGWRVAMVKHADQPK